MSLAINNAIQFDVEKAKAEFHAMLASSSSLTWQQRVQKHLEAMSLSIFEDLSKKDLKVHADSMAFKLGKETLGDFILHDKENFGLGMDWNKWRMSIQALRYHIQLSAEAESPEQLLKDYQSVSEHLGRNPVSSVEYALTMFDLAGIRYSDLEGRYKKTTGDMQERINELLRNFNNEKSLKDKSLEEGQELKAKIEALVNEHAKAIEEQEKSLKSETISLLNQQSSQFETKIVNLTTGYEDQITDKSKQNEAALIDQKTQYETNISKQKGYFESELINQKGFYESELADQKGKYESQIKALQSSHASELSMKINNLEVAHDKAIQALETQYETKIEVLENELNTLKARYTEENYIEMSVYLKMKEKASRYEQLQIEYFEKVQGLELQMGDYEKRIATLQDEATLYSQEADVFQKRIANYAAMHEQEVDMNTISKLEGQIGSYQEAMVTAKVKFDNVRGLYAQSLEDQQMLIKKLAIMRKQHVKLLKKAQRIHTRMGRIAEELKSKDFKFKVSLGGVVLLTVAHLLI